LASAFVGECSEIERALDDLSAPMETTKMNRSLAQTLTVLAVALAALTAAGCSVEPVGDPCTPENVPPGGFLPGEAYLETSSVQCRTRVCIVNGLEGDPNRLCEDDPTPPCVFQADIDNSVYCTCRCAGPPGAADFCTCPDNFECKSVLSSGGVGIRGSYCVKKP
jgi:hypothetical protein